MTYRDKDYHKNYYIKNKEKAQKQHLLWKNNNRLKCYYSQIKRRAKTKNIEFSLELKDLIIPEYCPILGIKLDIKNLYIKGNQDYKPSIDRINPKLGYTKNNICIISGRANRIKSDASINEIRAILKYMEKRN